MIEISGKTIKIKQATRLGYIEIPIGEASVADFSYPKSKLRRGRVQGEGQISPTITTTGGLYVIEKLKEFINRVRIRKLLPEECFILMGFTVDDCQKCRDIGLSNSALYKAAGNGLICQCVMLICEHLFKALYNEKYRCYDENFQ